MGLDLSVWGRGARQPICLHSPPWRKIPRYGVLIPPSPCPGVMSAPTLEALLAKPWIGW